jgi:mannose-6-phosphate isomerase class I
MEEIRAESVRELVLILVERMRVMDISLLELKSHLTTKVDTDLLAKLEQEIIDMKEIISFLKQRQDEEVFKAKTLLEQRENDAKKNSALMNYIYWAIGIGSAIFFVVKAIG